MNRRQFFSYAPLLPALGVAATAAAANEVAPPHKASLPFRFEAPDGNFMEVSYDTETRCFKFKTADTYAIEQTDPLNIRDVSMMQFSPPQQNVLFSGDPDGGIKLYHKGNPRYEFT